MADNKYRRYLNSEEYPRSSFLGDAAKEVTTVAGAVLAGTVAYRGLRYLDKSGLAAKGLGAVNKRISYMDSYLTGLNKTFDDSGVFRTLLGGAQDTLNANMREAFRTHAVTELRSELGKGVLNGAPTRFERTYSRLGKARKDLANSVITGVRLDQVLKDFRDLDWVKNNPDLSKALEEVLTNDKNILKAGFDTDFEREVIGGIHSNKPDAVIEKALDNALEHFKIKTRFKDNPAVMSGGMANDLKDILVRYGDRRQFLDSSKPYRGMVTEQLQKLRAAHDAQFLEMNSRTTAGTNIIQTMFPDYELLTVGKAEQMGMFDYTSITTRAPKRGGNIESHMLRPGTLQSMPGLGNMPVDPLVFVDRAGKVADFRFMRSVPSKAMKGLSNGFQIPLLNIKPFRLLSVFNRESLDNVPNYVFRRENVNSVLSFIGRDLPQDDYYFIGGNILNRNGDVVANNIKLASSKFGLFQREASSMAGYTKHPAKEPATFLEYIKNIYDVGNQEYPSSVSRKLSGITKFWDVDWERNIWYNIQRGTMGQTKDDVSKFLQRAYGKFSNTVDNMTSGLSDDTLKAFSSHIDPEIYSTMKRGTKKEGTMRAVFKLLQDDTLRDDTRYEFINIIKRYSDDPEGFERVVRTVRKGYQADLPEMLESLRINTTELISNIDQAEKLLHMELLHRSQNLSQDVTVGSMVKDMLANGSLTNRQAGEILDLYTLNDLRNLGRRGQLIAPEEFLGLLKQPKGESQKVLNEHLQQMIFKANPNLGVGPGQQAESFFPGTEFIPVRSGQVMSRTRQMMTDINSIIKSGGGITNANSQMVGDVGDKLRTWGLDTLGEFGFGTKKYRAGRDNLDNVTTTTFGFYHSLFRLNEGISKIGLGLSTGNMGSTQDIVKNMFLRRIFGPVAAFMGLSYLNYEAGNLTGEKPNQTLARMYANMTLDVQGLKDITGLNAISRGISSALPGFNLLYENPLGMALKYGSFGLLGEDRGYDEMKYYYERGYDPIRKGRFWNLGSNTPFYGDRISYFAPSWYRQTMGEPQYTNALYGSEGEYWGNTWFPNPRNLFGLKPIIDPYHWENKHEKDRPYPVTGGTVFREIPLIGPLIDMPISAIIKPPRRHPGLSRAHEEYLREINERYKAFISQAASGAMVQIYPGGRITPVANTGEGTGGDIGEQYGVGVASPYGSYGGFGYGVAGMPTLGKGGSGYGYGGGYGSGYGGGYGNGRGRGSNMAYGQLSAINQSYVAYSNVKPIDGRSIGLLRDHTYIEGLDEAVDPNSLAYRLGETVYSMTEIGGMYGFMANTIFGLEDSLAPRVALQSSSRMYGMERSFWDQNLGGLGGDISEIYRRFLPHKRNQVREYNPLANAMPSWMPGLDYFTDFKHGDPYIKIPKGEGRLPGPGYEAMNRLHPDSIFGRYGALDRFKILADVAPWSEQYKYYAGVISQMHQAGLIAGGDYEDVQRIKEMVTERKEKYDLYPYKYKYADQIDKKTVTVQRLIDATTFVTDEMPGVPIRLAGIKLPAKDTPEYQEIISELSNYLTPGKGIRIGLESDPLMQYNNDTMGTMPAVLYNTAGDPVQARLARKYKTIKADYEDNGATAVNALFERNTVTVGKIWESFAHLDTPFHTKFLRVRSPLEHYKRQMLYGKDWQSWSHPFRDWVGPTIDKMTTLNPVIATGLGAGLGALFGSSPKAKAIGAIIGGMVAGIPSSLRSLWEAGNRITGDFDYTWIPQRRREEREIEEYFDMLKYVKYRGLYEKARRVAITSEGLDPEAILRYSETQAGTNKGERRKLENIKRWLKIYDTGNPDSQKANIKAINERLAQISGNKLLMNAGPMTMRALQYRAEYMATLYGADPNGDLQVIYRALPRKDRPFFKHFMLAKPEEREEILRLVPKNQRRFYQAKFGMKPDRKPSLGEYFATHNLPDASWTGWKPGVSLEAVKLKTIEHTALDMGEFGFWPDDVEYAKGAPEVSIQKNPFDNLDIGRLKKVLAGAGIDNADVQITTENTDKPENLFNVNVNMRYDRRNDVTNAMNDNMAYLLSE